jgi:hypothetical protein
VSIRCLSIALAAVALALAAPAAAPAARAPDARPSVACFQQAGWQAAQVGQQGSEIFVLAVRGTKERLRALVIVLHPTRAQAVAVARRPQAGKPRIYRAGRSTFGCHGASPKVVVCRPAERALAQRCLGAI